MVKNVSQQKFSPIALKNLLSLIFNMMIFLLLVPVALNKGWSNCGGQDQVLRRITMQRKIYTWICSIHVGIRNKWRLKI